MPKSHAPAFIHIVSERLALAEALASALKNRFDSTVRMGPEALSPPETRGGDPRSALVLVDLAATPPEEIADALAENASARGDRPFALMLAHRSPAAEAAALALGARGIFVETEPLDMILRGVGAIGAGELWYSRKSLSERVASGQAFVPRPPPPPGAAPLTRREMEVLKLVCTGASNGQIADKLCISPYTVKVHIHNLFKKIGAKSRTEAMVRAPDHLR